jgi:hypothetical protein
VHGLEAEYADRIIFSYLDIDDPANDEFKQQLGYRYQPHLFLLDADGNVLDQWVGPVTREELEMAFQDALVDQ